MGDFKPKESKDHKSWYEIPGYGKYLANRKGELFTKKTGNATAGSFSGRYKKVSVFPDGSDKTTLVYLHDLICRAFKGSPKKGQVVLHDDNDRGNVKPGNLSWGTQSENVKNAYKDGLKTTVEAYPPSHRWL